jgi:hypothetical protein
MIITQGHQLYNTALEPYTGKQRSRLNGSDIDLLRAGGWDLVLYEATAYDILTETLGDLELTSATTCTRLPVAIPIEQQRAAMNLSRLQFRLGINAAGAQKRADLNAYIDTLTQDEQDRWLYEDAYARLSPLVLGIQTALGFSDAQLDTFFRNSALL